MIKYDGLIKNLLILMSKNSLNLKLCYTIGSIYKYWSIMVIDYNYLCMKNYDIFRECL